LPVRSLVIEKIRYTSFPSDPRKIYHNTGTIVAFFNHEIDFQVANQGIPSELQYSIKCWFGKQILKTAPSVEKVHCACTVLVARRTSNIPNMVEHRCKAYRYHMVCCFSLPASPRFLPYHELVNLASRLSYILVLYTYTRISP